MSKIYFFGCSYTFGHGLSDCRLMTPSDNPSKIGWAGQVANLAGKECINLADPGGSNRQAVHLAQRCDIQSGDIAIFHWTFMNRYFYIHRHPTKGILTTKVGNWMLEKTRNVRIRGHYHSWDEAHNIHDTEILVDYINTRFEKKGIRCINFEPIIYKQRNTMAQKTENLDKEIVERLKVLRDETDKIVIFLGQMAVQKRALNKKLNEISDNEEKYGAMNDKYIYELEEKLGEVDKKYKNGQIDLDKGTITFEE